MATKATATTRPLPPRPLLGDLHGPGELTFADIRCRSAALDTAVDYGRAGLLGGVMCLRYPPLFCQPAAGRSAPTPARCAAHRLRCAYHGRVHRRGIPLRETISNAFEMVDHREAGAPAETELLPALVNDPRPAPSFCNLTFRSFMSLMTGMIVKGSCRVQLVSGGADDVFVPARSARLVAELTTAGAGTVGVQHVTVPGLDHAAESDAEVGAAFAFLSAVLPELPAAADGSPQPMGGGMAGGERQPCSPPCLVACCLPCAVPSLLVAPVPPPVPLPRCHTYHRLTHHVPHTPTLAPQRQASKPGSNGPPALLQSRCFPPAVRSKWWPRVRHRRRPLRVCRMAQ